MDRRAGTLLSLAMAVAACGPAAATPYTPSKEPEQPVGSPTTTGLPTPAPTTTGLPTPAPTTTGLLDLPPSPDGFRWIYNVSYDERWAISIPAGWVYPQADSEGPEDAAVAALEARYPDLRDIIASRVNGNGYGHGLGFFDPAGARAGKFMYGHLTGDGWTSPPSDLAMEARKRAAGIAAQYGLATSAVHYRVVALPGGPAWVVDWTCRAGGPVNAVGGVPEPSGATIHHVQYDVFGPERTISLDMETTDTDWPTYGSIFEAMAATIRPDI